MNPTYWLVAGTALAYVILARGCLALWSARYDGSNPQRQAWISGELGDWSDLKRHPMRMVGWSGQLWVWMPRSPLVVVDLPAVPHTAAVGERRHDDGQRFDHELRHDYALDQAGGSLPRRTFRHLAGLADRDSGWALTVPGAAPRPIATTGAEGAVDAAITEAAAGGKRRWLALLWLLLPRWIASAGLALLALSATIAALAAFSTSSAATLTQVDADEIECQATWIADDGSTRTGWFSCPDEGLAPGAVRELVHFPTGGHELRDAEGYLSSVMVIGLGGAALALAALVSTSWRLCWPRRVASLAPAPPRPQRPENHWHEHTWTELAEAVEIVAPRPSGTLEEHGSRIHAAIRAMSRWVLMRRYGPDPAANAWQLRVEAVRFALPDGESLSLTSDQAVVLFPAEQPRWLVDVDGMPPVRGTMQVHGRLEDGGRIGITIDGVTYPTRSPVAQLDDTDWATLHEEISQWLSMAHRLGSTDPEPGRPPTNGWAHSAGAHGRWPRS